MRIEEVYRPAEICIALDDFDYKLFDRVYKGELSYDDFEEGINEIKEFISGTILEYGDTMDFDFDYCDGYVYVKNIKWG